jgi:hypothetical protein
MVPDPLTADSEIFCLGPNLAALMLNFQSCTFGVNVTVVFFIGAQNQDNRSSRSPRIHTWSMFAKGIR